MRRFVLLGRAGYGNRSSKLITFIFKIIYKHELLEPIVSMFCMNNSNMFPEYF